MTKASDQAASMADYFIERLSGWARVSRRRLFGACALYLDAQVFGMVWNGQLYFKVDAQTLPAYEAAQSHALGYVQSGDQRELKSYWAVPVEVIEDDAQLQTWASAAYGAAVRSAATSAHSPSKRR